MVICREAACKFNVGSKWAMLCIHRELSSKRCGDQRRNGDKTRRPRAAMKSRRWTITNQVSVPIRPKVGQFRIMLRQQRGNKPSRKCQHRREREVANIERSSVLRGCTFYLLLLCLAAVRFAVASLPTSFSLPSSSLQVCLFLQCLVFGVLLSLNGTSCSLSAFWFASHRIRSISAFRLHIFVLLVCLG